MECRRCGSAASTLLSGGKDPTETSKKKVPRVIDQLRGLSVVRVFCGGWAPGSGTLCLALCKNGTVYTWGQAFGTAHDPPSMVDPLASSVEYPKGLEALLGKRVTKVAVSSTHVLFMTSEGHLYGAGSNFHGQVWPLTQILLPFG